MILAANWKMNMGPDEARRFAERFRALVEPAPNRHVVFFPPAVSLEATARAFEGRQDVSVGIQDVYWEPKGAFTGATSVALAKAAGATTTLIGHSERRHVFGETVEDTQRKMMAAAAGGLKAYLCVGETLAQREAGETEAVVTSQLRSALRDAPASFLADVVVAYEPVWAIGTGRNATPDDAAQVHRVLRQLLAGLGQGESPPILYGGSVNPGNARLLLARPEIDGVLVGGASLDPAVWAHVIAEADAVPEAT
jgi:triosephosphate isomerase